ncbi:MAG: coenzyme F420-0:L-glutamate ligase [Candidatus Magasanikbacteria bacterium]|nr:coenzyme F420-0:L-glutamate ligase [Candidatus Magasanikbacteria bacterium]
MIVKPIKTRVFKEGKNLFNFITHYIKKLPEKSVLVVTSKIVALAENRTAMVKNHKEKERLIIAESQMAMPTKYVWLTIKDNMVMASAGIDESNAGGKLILLPKDSFKSAHNLRLQLRKKYKIKNLGVLITDGRTMPLRAGITGVALGYAGLKGIKNYIGTSDIFGKKFEFSKVDIADSLATAAVLVMGEGKERQPLAIIKNAPIEFCEKINAKELHIDIREDMYMPLFSKMSKQKGNTPILP